VTTRLRLFVLLVRPPVLLLLVMSLVLGHVQAGGGQSLLPLLLPALSLTGFLVSALALNDLADVAVDRVNLEGDPQRLLVSGARSAAQHVGTLVAGAVVALGAAGAVGTEALVVTAVTLTVSAAYSLPPLRLSGRGGVGSLVLPLAFVALPYLLGLFSASSTVSVDDVALLVGLYLGFLGRILLKDFRDVRGDALFGKRTFLVRHGRVVTCRTSAALWAVGTVVLALSVHAPSWALVAGLVSLLAPALLLLRQLESGTARRREERVVSALAVLGRGAVLLVIAHLSTADEGWARGVSATLLALLVAVSLGQAREMLRYGPRWGVVHASADRLPTPVDDR
jgi:4-hydroxybenzoate polyprenyltransferase